MTKDVNLYTWPTCPYCRRAKALLDDLNVAYHDHDIAGDNETKQKLIDKTGQTTVPYIFIGDEFIGGCDDLYALHREGRLEEKLKL